MKIHEYQAKNLFKKYRIPVLEGLVCFSVKEAVEAAIKLGGIAWAVKAQIHAGGRGKGGGVKIAKSINEVKGYAEKMLGMNLITHQTDKKGQTVRILFVEQGASIQKEFYIGMLVDRSSQRICLIVSSEGGMDIEGVSNKTPEKINKILIDPAEGLTNEDIKKVSQGINLSQKNFSEITILLKNLYKLFNETDASLVEINPLILTTHNQIFALDAKINFDDNSLFRHPEIEILRDLEEEDPLEIKASQHDLSYVPLDGNIGCLVNGAGLAMATMDIIKLYGGAPANFLDVGGGATTEKIAEAFKIMLSNRDLCAILVNIFGGIMRCDVIANGVVKAAKEIKLTLPLVVRLEGTNAAMGKSILAESGLEIILTNNMDTAAQNVVAAASKVHTHGNFN
ncbi:MAG: ADP-forming succinate--CoA ligase subunit beta [Nitrosomonadaceae bacterium]|nr:ADP-forming succinate--CoA ligase subunit beta [Nitrosomonadaceae bacterium]|tara:strand:+ start:166 stop:1353 length:1188 start_codon:yes stop_codon:yes gene_type:complete